MKHCCGNIMFPILIFRSPRKTLLQKQNLLPRKQKMFRNKLRNMLVAETIFPSLSRVFKCSQHEKHRFPHPLNTFKQCFKTRGNINNAYDSFCLVLSMFCPSFQALRLVSQEQEAYWEKNFLLEILAHIFSRIASSLLWNI